MTNFERIKAMTVEEMGEFLSDIYFEGFYDRLVHKYTVEWLESEVQEDDR